MHQIMLFVLSSARTRGAKGSNEFVTFFVFYTHSVMLSPRFIPKSVFYTQSVMLSLRFLLEFMFYTQSVLGSPQSAVRSPQSAVRSPQSIVFLTGSLIIAIMADSLTQEMVVVFCGENVC